ncbi:endonuclease/exonuclease/phosphatase family protein [uncultured Flavobacterium sp.]|uniref:endonuclease/exonuclease/phosphatase family protein n=1 Tax=uncultured Flavobacterium sp. TaxID=165435 RepID=UPI0030C8921D
MWFIIISSLLLLFSILPYTNLSNWFFKISEYGKIQIVTLQVTFLLLSFFLLDKESWLITVLQFATIIFIFIHLSALYKFTSFYKTSQKKHFENSSEKISLISANVYKDNNDFNLFKNLINKYKPNLFLTIESDKKWQESLNEFDKEYPFSIKIPLENTYGMHFYSKITILDYKVHYFVADDIPSIEAKLQTEDGYIFTFFGVHPPPPSPTEEDNSKERDGELLSVAKRVKNNADTCIIVGDFNNVAWAKSSILFRKTSKTIDGRIGKGFISTYHAKYFFMRFPIDLIFHTADIFMEELKKLEYFGSDHFPIYSKFIINKDKSKQSKHIENLKGDEAEEVEKLIEEGKKENSENRK